MMGTILGESCPIWGLTWIYGNNTGRIVPDMGTDMDIREQYRENRAQYVG
ncbi:hypothetical protein H5P36_16025 [Bacillus sp. APMAM]|nr:hypothetical protein [Bacillus sp. APMAM]